MNFFFKLSLIPSSVLGAVLIYKTYFGVPKYEGDEDLTGKVVIITGGSSGIGKELAYRIAIRKATLILACRSVLKCKESRLKMYTKTGNKNIYCSELDLESYDSINDFVKRVSEKFKNIDILINNAGYKGGTKRELSNEFVEKQLAINTVGPYMLTKGLIPLLSASESARVLYLVCPQYAKGTVNMDDINLDKNYDKDKAFSQSQLMRLLSMKYFADSFSTSQITFNACDPGPTYSRFHMRSNYNNNLVSRLIFRYINTLILRATWQAPETPIMCCVSDKLNGLTGKLYRDLEQLEIDEKALDPAMAKYVTLLCDKWTKSSNFKLPIQ